MARISNGSNVDIVDRPVNGKDYNIKAGETISNVPETDANELVAVYGFLTKSADVVPEVKKEVKEEKVEVTSNEVVEETELEGSGTITEEGEVVSTEPVVKKVRTRRQK